MISSTSNSNSDSKGAQTNESPVFVFKVLGLTLLMLLVYSLATKNILFKPFYPQSQFQDNQYKSEDFLNRIARIDPTQYSIIVGSSLAARLKEEYFSSQVVNLSFGGGSPTTGLEFISKTDSHFKRILIDSTILRPRDDEMLSVFQSKFELWRVRNIWATNVDHQPVSILSNFIREEVGSVTENEYNPKQFAQWLEFQKQVHGSIKIKDQDQFRKNLEELKLAVHQIRTMNIPLYFLEMPMDVRVSSMPMIEYYRKEIRAAFQGDPSIHWITFPDLGLQTIDGVHLTPDSAKILAKQLDQ